MRSLSVRSWDVVERVAAAWLLAALVALVACLMVVTACRAVAEVRRALGGREQGQGQGLTRQARTYPDPVCEWCGGVMDGKSCQCEGVEL